MGILDWLMRLVIVLGYIKLWEIPIIQRGDFSDKIKSRKILEDVYVNDYHWFPTFGRIPRIEIYN